MEEEIKAEFNKSGFNLNEEEEILKKCLTFCINYSLTPSDLVSSWELYYLNRQLNEPIVQNAEMDGFLLHLQNEQKEAAIKEEPNLHTYSSKDVDMILNDDYKDAREDIVGTPTDKSQKLYPDQLDSVERTTRYSYRSGRSPTHATPFGQRFEKFVSRFEISNQLHIENGSNKHDENDIDDEIIKRVQPRKRCSLILHESGPETGCRFMYDRIEDRFNELESRIRKRAAALAASGLFEEPGDPTVASQRSVFAVGMICCDGEGHLNDKSVLLQSSVEHAAGQSVRLDLHNVSQFSIFPGQVLGIEGRNPSGHCLIASRLVDTIPVTGTSEMDLQPAKKLALDQEKQAINPSSDQDEILLIVACGPFTTTDNLSFEPLSELLAYTKREMPQLLILMGPFIDAEHPEIRNGTIEAAFDEIFRVEVLSKLQDYVEYMGSDVRVVLVPSVRDAHHDFVFPQPAFDIHPPELKHQITSLTNPGILEANEVKVGCCTLDILKQLSGEELSRNPSGVATDRMGRLASHILRQRSFYPLYPPAESIPLDFSLAPEALRISSIPDILILPSDMKYFVKVLSLGEEDGAKCVCVNPGRLAKGEGGGTFAKLHHRGGPDNMTANIIAI